MAVMLPSIAPSAFLAFLLGCYLFVQQCSYASASLTYLGEPMSSSNCVRRIASTRDQQGDGCVRPVCGPLNTTGVSFEENLTPSCRAVLNKYTAKDLSSWTASFPEEPVCKSLPGSLWATNPVVVQTKGSNSFAFCTVPKAGCSQLRSLLFVMTSYPEIGEIWKVHMQSYPTLHHFDKPAFVPSSFPMFILGRSPYTRLLSGFLDKMAVQERGNDMHTLKDTNELMGRGEFDFFEQSKEGFRDFLVQITAAMRAGKRVNEHFAPMLSVCNAREVAYNYFLRLEEMPEWMSCLKHGLKLSQFTDSGWNLQRTHRSDWHSYHHRGCWWKPKGMSCQDYLIQSRELVDGERVEIELPESKVESGSENDVHSTSADDKWELFYDQELADLVYAAYRTDFEAFGYDRLVISH